MLLLGNRKYPLPNGKELDFAQLLAYTCTGWTVETKRAISNFFSFTFFFFAVEASGTFPASYVETIALKSLSCNVITNACECVSTELLGMVYHMDSMLVL